MRWCLVLLLLAGLARAEGEAPQPYPRLRTFIGGTSAAGGFSDGRYVTGVAGPAADVGVQVTPEVSFSGVFRSSTSGFQSWFQLAPTVEWSRSLFSVGLGVGAAVMVSFSPGARVDPYLAVPFHFGLTLDERPDGVRLGAMRLNVEVSFVWNPMSRSAGAVVGFSLGRQSR